jgi:hypothetical protein
VSVSVSVGEAMFKRLFGHQTSLQKVVPLAEAVRRHYPSLVLDVPAPDIERALTDWEWLAPPQTNVALVGAFGDLFFETSDGVVMLDMLEGTLRAVAKDREAFIQAVGDDDYRDELLGDVWVQAAARRGLNLGPGECFDWAVPPILGGQCSAENLAKTLIVVKISIAGQLHQQIKDLPPGTPITGFTVDE